MATNNSINNTGVSNATIMASLLSGYTVGSNSALSSSDTVVSAFGKIQGQINAILATPGGVTSVNGLTGAVTLTTTNITEGTNLYYTSARFNSAFSSKTTSDLTEGTNLYYTSARFNSAFSAKSTTDLSEGTNLYFTNARGIGSTLTGYVSGAGTVSSSDTLLQAIQKLNGNTALKANSASPTFTGTVTLDTIQASSSAGIGIKANGGTDIVLFGAGGGATGTFYGGMNFNTQITIGTASGTTGKTLYNGTTSGTVTLSVADAAGTWTMKLPTSAGTSGYVLQTDGSGNTSWVASTGTPQSTVTSLSVSYTIFYSDNLVYIPGGNSTTILLFSGGQQMYKSGVSQSVTSNAIWTSSNSYGSIVVNGYIYTFFINTGVARIYRCAVTSDIATAGNWTQLTISGTALPTGANSGLVGFDGTNFWVVSGSTQFIKYTLSGTTLTSNGTVTVTSASYDYAYDRVNANGIYAKFGSAPFFRVASLAGTLDNTKQVVGTLCGTFASNNAYYLQHPSGNASYTITNL